VAKLRVPGVKQGTNPLLSGLSCRGNSGLLHRSGHQPSESRVAARLRGSPSRAHINFNGFITFTHPMRPGDESGQLLNLQTGHRSFAQTARGPHIHDLTEQKKMAEARAGQASIADTKNNRMVSWHRNPNQQPFSCALFRTQSLLAAPQPSKTYALSGNRYGDTLTIRQLTNKRFSGKSQNFCRNLPFEKIDRAVFVWI